MFSFNILNLFLSSQIEFNVEIKSIKKKRSPLTSLFKRFETICCIVPGESS